MNISKMTGCEKAARAIADFSQRKYAIELDIAALGLVQVPKDVSTLKSLRILNLENNSLEDLPRELRDLGDLDELYLHGNRALGIPPEILGPRYSEVHSRSRSSRSEVTHRSYSPIVGYWRSADVPYTPPSPARPSTILDYYFRMRKEASQQLNEAKILILGQGGVGKTSLTNRLLHDHFDADEEKTRGINIAQWSIQGTSDDSDAGESQIRLNVWDFGGQDIMHATHQFFLTKRSLYLIVIDARKGENEGNIHYWLKIVQSYGADAPAIVVINKCETHHQDLNTTRLRKDYAPNLRRFFKVSCKTGEGVSELRSAIEHEIRQLDHIYDRLPVSYFDVKKQLEEQARERDYLDLKQYQRLCVKHGVMESGDQSVLLRFLHDLGSVLNFDDPEDPFELRDTNILNPVWVTTGIYSILNSNKLMQDGGILRRTHLVKFLPRKGYPKDRHTFILEMMRKFELAFDFPEGDPRILIPELLPRNEPDLEWHESASLDFQYHYRILPSGLICRFIVRMHRYLTRKPTYWRSGCVLQIEGCRTLVRADIDSGRSYVKIFGDVVRRREALSIVRHVLQTIHDTIPRLEVMEMVPLPDQSSIVVSYAHLRKLEERGIDVFMPEGSMRDYSVSELLSGIEKGKPFDVFLSYHSNDSEWVVQLKERLKEADILVWLDRDQIRPGDRFTKALEKGIAKSKSVVIVVSPGACESGWVREEYDRALYLINSAQQDLRLIPVILQHCDIPGFLSSRNSVQFAESDEFDDNVAQLIWGITGRKPAVQDKSQTLKAKPKKRYSVT